MPLEGGHGVAVQQVAGHGVAHQVEAALGALVPVGEAALRVADGPALQLADKVALNPAHLGQVHGEAALLRAQGPTGGSHADPSEDAAQLGLHPVRDGPGHLGHLIDVLDLPVQHGPLAVLLFFDGQDLQPLVHNTARNTDDAAGPNVQGEDQLPILIFCFIGHVRSPPVLCGYVLEVVTRR